MLKRIGTVSESALWQSIVEEGAKAAPIEPGEKTVMDLALAWRRDNKPAKVLADQMVADGKMTKRLAELPNGRTAWAYRPVAKRQPVTT
jgi:hypothetical protein